jgi:3-dehydroquinate synthase
MLPSPVSPPGSSSAKEASASPKNVTIRLPATERKYEILVASNLLAEAGHLIAKHVGARRCLIVTDENVGALYRARLEAVLVGAGHDLLPTITVQPGESSKSFAVLQDLLDQIFARGADRKTLLIALGGGVVGDLVGFAASIYMRSIDFIQIPTTLLAQVDSSVGGKTGIDTDYGKNTVGSFYQPRLVLIDVATLDSLPEREMLAGYAELVKYGLLADASFFDWCQAHGARLLNGDRESQIHAITRCCACKAHIVAADEHDKGQRALLNLGHTFGHALESVWGYSARLLHGEAVAIGTVMAFRLSSELGLCPSWDADAVQEHFEEVGLPIKPPEGKYDIDQLMTLMGQDKKAEGGKLNLVLVNGIGKACLVRDVNPYPVKVLWKNIIGL